MTRTATLPKPSALAEAEGVTPLDKALADLSQDLNADTLRKAVEAYGAQYGYGKAPKGTFRAAYLRARGE